MAGQRFSTESRIRKRRDFVRIQRRGEVVRTRHFVLLVSRRAAPAGAPEAVDATGPARLGLVASRRVASAVGRNRGKRLVREWFRRRQQRLPAGIDLVVILRPQAPQLAFADVVTELDAALPRLLERARKLSGAVDGTAAPGRTDR